MTGSVKFTPLAGRGVLVAIDLAGLVPGRTHAIHIHDKPFVRPPRAGETDCCATLGGHFNPLGATHGSRAGDGMSHAGDLCNNITADGNGHATFKYVDDDISLDARAATYIGGRSVVVHDHVDDAGEGGLYGVPYTQMSDDVLAFFGRGVDRTALVAKSLVDGNAGKRIACANILPLTSGS